MIVVDEEVNDEVNSGEAGVLLSLTLTSELVPR